MQFLTKALLLLVASVLGTLPTAAVASEMGTTTVDDSDPSATGTEEEQLGEIRILSPEQKKPSPTLKLLIRSSVFSSSNLASVEDFDKDNLTPAEQDLLGDFERSDVTFANSIFLQATPALDANTSLIAYGGGSLVRYGDNSSLEYNALNLGLGIQRQFNSQMFGELRWSHHRLYDAGNGNEISSPNNSDAFLVDNSIRASWQRRDFLSKQFTLHSAYALTGHIVNPDELSHITNQVNLALSYQLAPQWKTKLGYGIKLDSFTTAERTDFQQQLQGIITYRPTDQFFIEGLVGYRFGDSSLDGIDPDAFRAGIRLGYDFALF